MLLFQNECLLHLFILKMTLDWVLLSISLSLEWWKVPLTTYMQSLQTPQQVKTTALAKCCWSSASVRNCYRPVVCSHSMGVEKSVFSDRWFSWTVEADSLILVLFCFPLLLRIWNRLFHCSFTGNVAISEWMSTPSFRLEGDFRLSSINCEVCSLCCCLLNCSTDLFLFICICLSCVFCSCFILFVSFVFCSACVVCWFSVFVFLPGSQRDLMQC